MTDSQNLDDREKLNIIFKEILGFPSTSENISYYEELKTKFNTYTLGENVLLQDITQYPDFDISGLARNAIEVGLQPSDFYDYSYNQLNKSQCSIVDDSTGTVRRFKYLILQQTYGTENSNYGASWFKLDNSLNNILEDSLQYNYKSYYDINASNALKFPYLYKVYTERSLRGNAGPKDLPFGADGGNWVYNYKNGILFFSDFNNLAQKNDYGGIYNITNNNKPVISVYKYIGKKNISSVINSLDELTNSVNNNLIKVFTYALKLSHKINNLTQLFTNNANYSNKIFFDATTQDFSTNTTALIDLSNSFYNTIIPTSDNTNILVTVNATLYCSYGTNERITIQIWRDLSMIIENVNIGSVKAMEGLTIPYNYTHLDENISSGLKKYYLKYKLESFNHPNNHPHQGIINVRTSQSQGSSDILLREITKMPTIVDFSIKLLFNSNTPYTTNTSNLIDLSNSFFNIINPCNNNYILVNINATITSSYGYNENITIQLWRDTTMIFENNNIGSINATGGFAFPYSITYLDENHDNNSKKYYLKYKLQREAYNRQDGIINVRTSTINGSSNFILQEYRNMSNNNINIANINYDNVVAKTINTGLVDLSNIVFQTINACNNSNIIVSINVTLFCSYAYNETITIELWRDNSIIMRDSSLGTINTSGGLTFPYNVTYLDANVSNGIKKYYLKYKLDHNNSNGVLAQGLINIKTSQIYGSSNILLRESSHSSPIYNRLFYDSTSYTTTTSDLIDLSDSFYNSITLSNNANVMVNINVTLLCCYAIDETITIELWRDLSMIVQDSDLGIILSTGGFTIPYSLTYLDTNVNSGTIKYYIKYKLKNNNSMRNMGLVNISNYNSIGSSSFFLRQI